MRSKALNKVKDFRSFDPKIFASATETGRTVVTLRKGENVFSRGDAARFIVYVKTGRVALTIASGNKTHSLVLNFRKGDFFGEECLMEKSPRKGTATCVTRTAVLHVVRKEVFLRMLRQDAELSRHFLAYLLARTIRIERHLAKVVLGTRTGIGPTDTGPSARSAK